MKFGYRSYLRNRLEQLKKVDRRRFSHKALAETCRVLPPYLSNALNEKGHLSSDQVYLALNFLQFTGDERDYVETLYESERTGIADRREQLLARAKEIEKSLLKTESHLSEQIEATHSDEMNIYFLDPKLQMIHLALAIEDFRKHPEKIVAALGMTRDVFNRKVALLTKLELVKISDDGYRVLKHKLHLPDDHPLIDQYRKITRLKSIDRDKGDDDICFSVFYTADPEAQAFIRKRFLAFVSEVEDCVEKSADKGVYQINFDCLNWI